MKDQQPEYNKATSSMESMVYSVQQQRNIQCINTKEIKTRKAF